MSFIERDRRKDNRPPPLPSEMRSEQIPGDWQEINGIDSFLSHHPEIPMTPALYAVCQWAETIMSRAVDPLHNQAHIDRMYTTLHHGLQDNAVIQQLLHHGIDLHNLPELLTAIAAHDVYRSTIPLQGNILDYLTGFVFDGFGSDQMFKQYAAQIGLAGQQLKNISHAVCQHGAVHLPRRSSLAHALADFDRLDMYSLERIGTIYSMMMNNLPVSPQSIEVSRIFLQFSRKDQFMLPWVQDMYLQLREPALIALHELYRDYEQAYLARIW